MPVNTWVSGGDDDGDAVHEEIWCLTAKMQQDNEIGSKCFAYAAGEGIIQFIAVLAGISLHRFAATCIGLQLACRWGRWVAATRKMHHHHLINSKLKFTIFQAPSRCCVRGLRTNFSSLEKDVRNVPCTLSCLAVFIWQW
jgi:hypothetical protein